MAYWKWKKKKTTHIMWCFLLDMMGIVKDLSLLLLRSVLKRHGLGEWRYLSVDQLTLLLLPPLSAGGGIAVEYYPVEFLPTRWRHVVPLIPCWPLGMMAFAGTAWCLEDWSQLHIATALLGATLILGYL